MRTALMGTSNELQECMDAMDVSVGLQLHLPFVQIIQSQDNTFPSSIYRNLAYSQHIRARI
jgi:hypothetical protein